MSLVTEVLSSAGKLEKEDLSGRITKLKRRIDEIKLDVQESLNMYWIEFSPCFATATDLTNKLNTAQNEIESLVQKMENEIKPQIQVAVSDFQELSNQLKDARTVADMVENLMKIHEYMEACDEAQGEKNYLLAAQSLQQANLYNRTDICGRDVKIFQTLNTELVVKKEKLHFDLQEVWNQLIVWTVDGNTATLTVLTDSTSREEVISLVRALYLMNNLNRFIEIFGKKLLMHILKPVITSVVHVNTSSESALIITIKRKNRPLPLDVFSNLRTVFSFLCNTFLNITLVKEVNECSSSETVMNILGKIIGHEFCKCLVEDCLDVALPSHTKDLEEYSKVIKLTTDLQQSLVDIGFLQKDLSTALEYVQNIDILFANKMCQQFLICARNTLKKELHNTIVVYPESPSFEPFENVDTLTLEQTEEKLLLPQKGLSSDLFKFPKCQISVFTKEILELVHEVMQEATKSNSTCAAKLFYTARNICELYCDVVPIYHQDTITLIPQQTAIYHNNCMYLAHNLLILGHQYQNRLPAPLLACPVTFVDLVSQLRASGKDLFLSQMRQQKQQLLQFLQDNAVFQNLSTDERMLPKAEQAVKQCLCQLQFLSRAWSETLPSDVYCRAIGTLLNTCLEEIMLRIVCMEDITVPCAARLVSIFSLITSQVPDLFKSEEKETTAGIVNFYVRKWNKFQRLQWILGASMREIVDLWANGKGVLAADFAADEIKQLIRALFQNTDRRAAALAKIR